MFDFLKKKSAKGFLEQNSETNEVLNTGKKSIRLIVDDFITNEPFETHIGPGEKLGLKEGMKIKYAKFET